MPATVITGEAGIGKSHLIAEVKRRLLAEASVTWLECRGDAQRAVALAPFVALLRELTFQELGSDDADRLALFETTISDLCHELKATGDDEAQRLAASLAADITYLGALVGLEWAESPYEAHDPRTRLDRCLEAYVRLLRAESRRRPVVLHVDHGQWLDLESQRLVELIERSAVGERVAVLISARPSAHVRGEDALRLGPLDRDGVAGVAASRLAGEPSSGLVDLLVARSQGNPLFADQLALAMQEGGRVGLREDGEWSLRDHGRDELPVSLITLLVSRLDGLEADVRDVVQCAAVIGGDVELDVLAAMVGGDVQSAVDGASAAGIWDVDDGRAAFRQELLREAAYQMQPDDRLRARHASVANALRAASSDGQPAAAELAHHYELAGDPGEAFAHLRRAAAEASQLPAHREARVHLRRAAVLASAAGVSDEEIAAVHLALAEVAAMLGEYATAVDELTSAALPMITPTTRVEILCQTGEAYERWGRLSEAEAAYDEAVVALQEVSSPGLAGRIYGSLAMLASERGDHQAASELADLAMMLVSEAGDRDQLAEAHHRLAVIALQRGDLDTAADHARRSLAAFTETSRPAGSAAALNNLGLIALRREDVAGAIDCFEEAVGGFEVVGNEPGLARALGNLADALARAGRTDDAIVCVERAVEILARIGLDEQGVVASMWKAGSW